MHLYTTSWPLVHCHSRTVCCLQPPPLYSSLAYFIWFLWIVRFFEFFREIVCTVLGQAIARVPLFHCIIPTGVETTTMSRTTKGTTSTQQRRLKSSMLYLDARKMMICPMKHRERNSTPWKSHTIQDSAANIHLSLFLVMNIHCSRVNFSGFLLDMVTTKLQSSQVSLK